MSDRIVGLDSFDTVKASDEGATMEVRSPETGEVLRWPSEDGSKLGRPWTVTYYGMDSERVRDAIRRQTDRRTQHLSRTRTPIMSSASEKDNIELLVIATKGWDIPLSNGEPAASSPDEYRTAYTKYPWLFEQGNEFAGLRANFLKKKQGS